MPFRKLYTAEMSSVTNIYSVGNFYPRGATLGGSAQVNAMNFIWSPDNEWDYIANLTGDRTWSHHHMRQHFAALENCTYVPRGAPGHGYNGYIEVNELSPRMFSKL